MKSEPRIRGAARRGRLIDRARRPKTGPVVVAVVLLLPVVFAALFYVWTRVATVRLGYAISEAGSDHQQLVEENRGLRIEVAALKSPQRLEQIGRERFRLRPPLPEQVVKLESRAK